MAKIMLHVFTMILNMKKAYIDMVSDLKYRAETCFQVSFSSPHLLGLPVCLTDTHSHACVFIFLLCYTEGRGLYVQCFMLLRRIPRRK